MNEKHDVLYPIADSEEIQEKMADEIATVDVEDYSEDDAPESEGLEAITMQAAKEKAAKWKATYREWRDSKDLQMGYRSDPMLPKNKGVNTVLKVFPNTNIVELHFATKLPFNGEIGKFTSGLEEKVDPKEVIQNIYDNVDGIVSVDASRRDRYSIRFEKGEAFTWEPILTKVIEILTTLHPEKFYGINVDVSDNSIEAAQEMENRLQMEAERRYGRD